MNTADRRTEIINILIIRRRTTARELADEFGVTTRTIQKDIQALSPGYPIYTKQGGDGGIVRVRFLQCDWRISRREVKHEYSRPQDGNH